MLSQLNNHIKCMFCNTVEEEDWIETVKFDTDSIIFISKLYAVENSNNTDVNSFCNGNIFFFQTICTILN